MLTCKEASRLVSESLDRELPLRSRVALRIHLMMCSLCRRYRRQLRFLSALLGQYALLDDEEEPAAPGRREPAREHPAPEDLPALSSEARQRIQERLSAAPPPPQS